MFRKESFKRLLLDNLQPIWVRQAEIFHHALITAATSPPSVGATSYPSPQ